MDGIDDHQCHCLKKSSHLTTTMRSFDGISHIQLLLVSVIVRWILVLPVHVSLLVRMHLNRKDVTRNEEFETH